MYANNIFKSVLERVFSAPPSLPPSLAGERCGCWWDSLYCLLPPLQALHSQADTTTGAGDAGSRRLSIHPGVGIHLRQVS